MLFPVILCYLFLKRGLRFALDYRSWVLVITFILSITTFVIVQNPSEELLGLVKYPSISHASCIWSSYKCGSYTAPDNKIRDYYPGPYDFYVPKGYVNRIDSKTLSTLGYVFLGIGTVGTYDKTWLYDGNKWNEYNYFAVNNTINPVYLLSSMLILCAIVLCKRRKDILLLLALMLLFMFVYYPFNNMKFFYFIQSIALGVIPLTSAGVIYISKKVNKKRRSLLVFTLVMVLISPFFTQEVYDTLKINKNLGFYWERLNSIITADSMDDCSTIKESRLRKECTGWIVINRAIKGEGCNTIKDEDLRLKCLPKETSVKVLEEQMRVAQEMLAGKTPILKGILHKEGQYIGMEECFDKDTFYFLCSGAKIYNEDYLNEIGLKGETRGEDPIKLSMYKKAITQSINDDNESLCKEMKIETVCNRINEVNDQIVRKYGKNIFHCINYHSREYYLFDYKCAVSRLI